MKIRALPVSAHGSALASYLGNEVAQRAFVKEILACLYVRKHTYRVQGEKNLIICVIAHILISRRFLYLQFQERFSCSLIFELFKSMGLSVEPGTQT